MKYNEKLINDVNKLKEEMIALANKVNSNEDARIECGILNRDLANKWPSIDATIFAEEPSELERQIDAAIAQAYQTPT